MGRRGRTSSYCLIGCSPCDCQQLKERQKRMLLCGNVKALHHHTHALVRHNISDCLVHSHCWPSCESESKSTDKPRSLHFFHVMFRGFTLTIWKREDGRMHEIYCVVTCNVTRKWKGSEPTMRSNSVERKWGHQGSPLFHLWRSHNRASFCCPVSLCLLRLPQSTASRSNHLRAACLGASSMSSSVTYEAFWICTLWNFSTFCDGVQTRNHAAFK